MPHTSRDDDSTATLTIAIFNCLVYCFLIDACLCTYLCTKLTDIVSCICDMNRRDALFKSKILRIPFVCHTRNAKGTECDESENKMFHYEKIIVLFLYVSTLCSMCFFTARERTIFSRSLPLSTSDSGVSL